MHSVPASLSRKVTEIEGWLELERPEKALKLLPPLLETTGARPEGLYLRVRALVALQRHEDALSDITELRTFEADLDWLDLTEAWCRKRLGQIDRAARCMEKLVKRSRRCAVGHYNLGCYLALLGDKERAIDELTIACGIEDRFRREAAEETDLDSLRGDPAFEQLLA